MYTYVYVCIYIYMYVYVTCSFTDTLRPALIGQPQPHTIPRAYGICDVTHPHGLMDARDMTQSHVCERLVCKGLIPAKNWCVREIHVRDMCSCERHMCARAHTSLIMCAGARR